MVTEHVNVYNNQLATRIHWARKALHFAAGKHTNEVWCDDFGKERRKNCGTQFDSFALKQMQKKPLVNNGFPSVLCDQPIEKTSIPARLSSGTKVQARLAFRNAKRLIDQSGIPGNAFAVGCHYTTSLIVTLNH